MSREYAENRIREALRQTGGNVARARQLIVGWTYEDHKLLQALTRPHLAGIVAYAVDRVVNRDAGTVPETQAEPVEEGIEGEQFGKELLRALVSGQPAIFGQENAAAYVKPTQASQRHIDTLKQLSGGKKKPGSGGSKKK